MAAELPRKYSQDQVSIVVGGASIRGLTDDGLVVTPVNPRAFAEEGANGAIGIAIRETRLYTVVFNILQHSPDNAILQARFALFSEFIVRDNFGGDLERGIIWGETPVELAHAKEFQPRVWNFGGALKVTAGGNDPALPLVS